MTTKTTMRLNKLMSRLDICSRREADAFIRDGKVAVDGVTATQMGLQVRLDATITVEGKESQEMTNSGITLMLHKPVGVVSSQAEHGHTPALSLMTQRTRSSLCLTALPSVLKVRKGKPVSVTSRKGLASLGRLDLDSSGLLLFSNDGTLAKKLIGSVDVEKEYEVVVAPQAPHVSHDKSVIRETSSNTNTSPAKRWRKDGTYETIERWRTMENDRAHFESELAAAGQRNTSFSMALARKMLSNGTMQLDGKQLRTVVVEPMWSSSPSSSINAKNTERWRFILTEGRKRQIRRMCSLVGVDVIELKRVRVGSLKLNALKQGEWQLVEHASDIKKY